MKTSGMTNEQIKALQARAGMKLLLIEKMTREIDTLNKRRINYQKELNNLSKLIEAAQTASNSNTSSNSCTSRT